MPQSLSLILVHLVFSTKNREPLIHSEIEGELQAFLGGIARDCSCPAISIGGTEDHRHLLCSLSRTVTVASLVENLKTRSSKWIKTKERAYAGFSWQAGYGAFSIGKSQIGVVQRYIANQKQHHKSVSFQDELRVFLKKYDVTYDERYIWD